MSFLCQLLSPASCRSSPGPILTLGTQKKQNGNSVAGGCVLFSLIPPLFLTGSSLLTGPEGLMAKERENLKRLKCLRRYRQRYGVEALLHRQLKERRMLATDGAAQQVRRQLRACLGFEKSFLKGGALTLTWKMFLGVAVTCRLLPDLWGPEFGPLQRTQN